MELHDGMIPVPREVRFPVELRCPEGFEGTRPETWPKVEGRLEYVKGRLLYMPPCGELQQETVADVVMVLGSWLKSHPDFSLGTNEAGMIHQGEVRAADVGLWRRTESHGTGLRRTPPVLAVEVIGQDEVEQDYAEKIAWYENAGVEVVWLLLPVPREVVVITRGSRRRFTERDRLPDIASLPDLTPQVSELFRQVMR